MTGTCCTPPAKCKSFLASRGCWKVPHKQFLLGMRFPVVSSADALGGEGVHGLSEGVEGMHIPCSLEGGSRVKISGQESWPQDALLNALLSTLNESPALSESTPYRYQELVLLVPIHC